MNNEFKKSKNGQYTVYTLESATSMGSGSIASVSSPMGGVQKRGDNLIAQEANTDKIDASKPRNFVAKNAKTGGAGAHKDKKKAAKQGDAKHKNKDMDMAEGSEQQYAVTIDAIDHGVLAPVTVVAGSPEEAKQKAIAGVKASMIKRGYELIVRSVSAKPEQGVAEGKDDKIAQLKKDHDTAVHWSKNEKSPQKRETARQKAEKIKRHLDTQYKQGVEEAEKNPHTSALGKALYRDLSKEKKASPAQVQRNKERWAQRQAEREQGVAEGLNDTQKKIEDTINKLEDRLKHAKSDEQWDRISARIERLQAGLNRSKQGVAEGLKEKEYIVIASMGENDYELEFRAKTPEGALMQAKKWQKQNHIREVHFTVKEQGVAEGSSKRDQQDVAAIRAAIARLEAQLNHPNADRDAIQQSISHEKKRLALYGVTEGLRARLAELKQKLAEVTANPAYLKAAERSRQDAISDEYMESLARKLAEKIPANAPTDVWVQDFQKADPNKYHQFKNKTPAKKAQMAVAASYAAKNPSKK